VSVRLRTQFRILTVVQVCLLTVTLVVLILTMLETSHLAVPVVLAGIALLQVFALIHFVHAHVNTLEEFFAAVNYEDFTRRFIEDDVDVELKEAFNKVLGRFQNARADRDMQATYLDTVIRHVPIAFFAARADGSLSLVNNPARRLTGMPALANIQDLAKLDDGLPTELASIEAGQQRLLQTNIRGLPVELRVSVAEIRMAGEVERLYSIENLSGELSARESSAWRNLIRVLTHEIMNTLTPITSLAQTTVGMLDEPDAAADIREAITTISRRSEGMIRFVSRYRELLHVPEPSAEDVGVAGLLNNVVTLLQPSIKNISIKVEVVPESLIVFADRQLIDQVLINLVKNAGDALTDTADPQISLAAKLSFGRVIISVTDNGPGIHEDDIDQVFIPFFTTKREGSGIGLSLSRQIMTAHKGDIALESGPSGTTFSLVFA
jgi:nitrogen fixation/metabolism regulation signal transduction histidine kinase